MMAGPGLEHKALVAIGAFDLGFVAHFQEDLGMAQCTAAAITGNAAIVSFDDFGGRGRQGK